MKQKIIIDNRTQEPTDRLLKHVGNFIEGSYVKSYIDEQSQREIFCSLIKNECSKRILFTYKKIVQKELF